MLSFTRVLFGIGDNGAEAVAAVEGVDGSVGGGGDVPALHVDGVRHVVVHQELAGQAALHQSGHRGPALPPAKRSALPHAPGDQLERARGEHLPRGSDAYDTRLAPAAVRTLERRTHHIHVPRAVERVVHAPLGHAHDNLLDGSAAVVKGADAVSAPELPGDGELVLVEVDADDARRPRHLRRLHHGEAHRAKPKDRDAGPRLHLARVPHRAQAGGHPAAKETRLIQGHARVNFRRGNLGDDGVLGERGTAHEVEDGLAVQSGEARGAVGHHPGALGGADGRAQVRLGRGAEDAAGAIALRGVARDDVVPGRHRGHPRTHALHHCAGLVAQDAREQTLWIVSVEGVDVGVAHRVGHHLDADLARLGRRNYDSFVGQRLVGCPCHSGLALDGLAGGFGELGECGRVHGDVHSGGGGGGGERLGVELDVIFHVGRDEKVRVVAASVSAHGHLLSHFLSRCLERLRLELLCQKLVVHPLVDENVRKLCKRCAARRQQLGGVVRLAGSGVA
mmetsp:Transcript_4649/g.11484  ORF Transcript_4649/g.11484 Transcript_4649/m.11484 type:complete len:507 (+) Transcript_4649:107-1627(+)